MPSNLDEGAPEDLLAEEVTTDEDGEVTSGPKYSRISEALKGNQYNFEGTPGWSVSRFKDNYIREANIAARAGMNENEIAGLFGITTKGMQLWKYQFPEFKQALEEGKALWDNRIEASFAQVAMGYEIEAEKIFMTKDGDIVRAKYVKHYPPNHVAAAIWLSNRRPERWSKKALEGDVNNVTVNVTVDQVRASIDEKLSRLANANSPVIEGSFSTVEKAPGKLD